MLYGNWEGQCLAISAVGMGLCGYGISWDIYSSPFAIAQSQCFMLIGRDRGLRTLF